MRAMELSHPNLATIDLAGAWYSAWSSWNHWSWAEQSFSALRKGDNTCGQAGQHGKSPSRLVVPRKNALWQKKPKLPQYEQRAVSHGLDSALKIEFYFAEDCDCVPG